MAVEHLTHLEVGIPELGVLIKQAVGDGLDAPPLLGQLLLRHRLVSRDSGHRGSQSEWTLSYQALRGFPLRSGPSSYLNSVPLAELLLKHLHSNLRTQRGHGHSRGEYTDVRILKNQSLIPLTTCLKLRLFVLEGLEPRLVCLSRLEVILTQRSLRAHQATREEKKH